VRTPSDFEKLRAHLRALDSAVETFCKRNGFVEQTTALGRYPRRRLTRVGKVNLFIDLQIDSLDEDAYLTTAASDLPYSMGAGAWCDRGDHRTGKTVWCFQGVRFRQVSTHFLKKLEDAFALIDGWDEAYLETYGVRSSVGRRQ